MTNHDSPLPILDPIDATSPLPEDSVAGAIPLDAVADLEAQLAQEKDKALRAWAELENYKRRKETEFDSARRYAIEKLVLDLLPIIDNFDRAMDSVVDVSDGWLSGLQMIRKQLSDALEKVGVTPIEALDAPFDPTYHMAVSTQSKEGVPSNHVIQVFQHGYLLHGKVIRPAMVVVSS